MAHYVLEGVQESATGTGTGALNLGGATSLYRSLVDAGVATAGTFLGRIEHQSAEEWELCLCTLVTGTPNTITRGTLYASSTGSRISFSSGTKTVTLVEMAAPFVHRVRNVTSGIQTQILATDFEIIVNKSSGAAHEFLAPTSPVDGQTHLLSDGKGDAATNNITFTGTINGGASLVIVRANYGSAKIRYSAQAGQWNTIY